ncbi:MAG: hypothetical protein Ct9H300mP2_1220 [Candidatus Neomarinimicrobiota bacterium]|nr:MAG: hypothetical protein Ct9H300mP2_1220 [Candidatus Neomarinimicrobiota bacterium]
MANWDEKHSSLPLLATLAAFSWGSSTVLGKHALKELPFTTVTALRLLLTAIVALIIFVITQGGAVHISFKFPHQWRILILIVLSTGAVALFIYYYGLKNLPASHATVYELTWPLSAVIIDWVVRGRILSLSQIIGATLILGSMTLLAQEKRND